MGACPICCPMHGRLPGVLQYARGAYRMNCIVQRRLPSGLAGCTSACSAGLQGVVVSRNCDLTRKAFYETGMTRRICIKENTHSGIRETPSQIVFLKCISVDRKSILVPVHIIKNDCPSVKDLFNYEGTVVLVSKLAPGIRGDVQNFSQDEVAGAELAGTNCTDPNVDSRWGPHCALLDRAAWECPPSRGDA
ncbi:hypothetical protein CRG98_019568 [Punica granatum]|uniref:Uncharacterized protein n=1 Tax=Punica granatum TaxID=22663 RepID=A0A2I0JUP2_PUNGR|nr:hypothetical protein CRG98_019568 [Punica granatum]